MLMRLWLRLIMVLGGEHIAQEAAKQGFLAGVTAQRLGVAHVFEAKAGVATDPLLRKLLHSLADDVINAPPMVVGDGIE